MKCIRNLPHICQSEFCDSSKILCNTLSVAIEESYREFITATDPIAAEYYRAVWFSFVDAADELSYLGFNNEPIEAAVTVLCPAIVDAFIMTQQPIPAQIVLLLTRTLRQDWHAVAIAA